MAEQLNNTLPERQGGKLTIWGAYAQHRRDSRGRGIAFLLTFEQWLLVWVESKQIYNRGPKLGQYVMARFGDKGPYALGNVKIITAAENHREANIGVPRPKSPEHRRKHSEAMRGKKHTAEHNTKIGAGVRRAFAEKPLKERHRG